MSEQLYMCECGNLKDNPETSAEVSFCYNCRGVESFDLVDVCNDCYGGANQLDELCDDCLKGIYLQFNRDEVLENSKGRSLVIREAQQKGGS